MDNGVPRVQLKRVNPFMGLMIDAQTWVDSHDYHRSAEQAHALALHGWGIATGLEVDAADPPDRTVQIRPGVALDPEGRLILVAQPFRYQITTQAEGPIYLVLMFREIPSDPMLSVEDGSEHPSRLLEAYAIYERERLPDQAYVELARINLSAGRNPVRPAANPAAPKTNEIDTRYREQVAIRPSVRTTVGVWKPDDVADTQLNQLSGTTRLFSVLTSGIEWRLRRRDQPPANEEPLDCDLLIMLVTAKTTISPTEGTLIATFLDGGGVLLVEAGGGGADVQKAIGSVAQAAKRKPQPVKRDHPLLLSKHVFAAPPAGAATGQLFEADGLILSTADYPSAWNGGLPDKALDRDIIRASTEFAENLLAYAIERRSNARRVQRNDGRK